MTRTLLAAVAALLMGVVVVGGLGVFLGFPAGPSLVTGTIVGIVGAAILLGAAARAGTLRDDPPR
ncbi:MAG: hypothetical protein ACLGIR_04640 [Actinomycetes bacterium]